MTHCLRLFLSAAVAVSGVLVVPGGAGAAIYVKIDGVPGDVAAEGYGEEEWLAVQSGSYGVERDLVGSVRDGTADLNLGIGRLLPIGLATHWKRAAAPLFQAAVDGSSVGDVEIHLLDGGEVFSIIRLERAFVRSAVVEAGEGSEGRPWFEFELLYSAIEMTNLNPDPRGGGDTLRQVLSWDLVTSSGGFSDGVVANEPPVVDPIGGVRLAEDGAIDVPVFISDPDGPAASLAVAATSSDTALVPDGNLIVSGEGGSRLLSVRPALDRHGTAMVTVTVSDHSSSVSTAFEVTVDPVPDPPAIGELAPVVAGPGVPVVLPVPVSDPDQAADGLLLSAVVADPSILAPGGVAFAFGASGWEMTLTPEPAAAGSTEVVVTVADATGAEAAARFLLTVEGGGNHAPTGVLLEPAEVAENAPVGTVVGELGAVDPDGGDGFVFTLLDGAGAFGLLDGSRIVTTAVLDYEEADAHRVRVRVADPTGLALESTVAVAVVNVNEPPVVTLAPPLAVEQGETRFHLGHVGLSDPDAGDGDVTVEFAVEHGVLGLDDAGVLAGKVTGNATGAVLVTAPLGSVLQVIGETGLVYTPEPGYTGPDSLSATVGDNGHAGAGGALSATASATFRVGEIPLVRWLGEVLTPEQQLDPAVGGLLSDGDGDGLALVAEYKLGKHPLNPDDAGAGIDLSETRIGDDSFFELTFLQRPDAGDPSTTLTVAVATALSAWNSGPGFVEVISRAPAGGGLERVTVRSTRPRSVAPEQFFRFVIEFDGELP